MFICVTLAFFVTLVHPHHSSCVSSFLFFVIVFVFVWVLLTRIQKKIWTALQSILHSIKVFVVVVSSVFCVCVCTVHYVVRMSNLFNCVLRRRRKESLFLSMCAHSFALLMRLFCFVLCKIVSVSFFFPNYFSRDCFFSFLVLLTVSCSSTIVNVGICVCCYSYDVGRFFFFHFLDVLFFCWQLLWCKILNDYPMLHTHMHILRLWLTDEIIYRRMTKLNNCTFS